MCKLFGQNSLMLQEFVAQGNPRGDFRQIFKGSTGKTDKKYKKALMKI